MSKIIMFGGKKRCGKGLATSILKAKLEEQGKTVKVMSLASPLKGIIAQLFGVSTETLDLLKNNPDKYKIRIDNLEQTTDFRELLQIFGTDIRDKYLGQSFWVGVLLRKLEHNKDDFVIIDDWRFPFEYELLNKVHFVFPYIIERDLQSEDAHTSETALDAFTKAINIENNDTIYKFSEKLQEQLLYLT